MIYNTKSKTLYNLDYTMHFFIIYASPKSNCWMGYRRYFFSNERLYDRTDRAVHGNWTPSFRPFLWLGHWHSEKKVQCLMYIISLCKIHVKKKWKWKVVYNFKESITILSKVLNLIYMIKELGTLTLLHIQEKKLLVISTWTDSSNHIFMLINP